MCPPAEFIPDVTAVIVNLRMLAQDGIVLNEVQGELMISKQNYSKKSHALFKMRGVLDTQAYRPLDLAHAEGLNRDHGNIYTSN